MAATHFSGPVISTNGLQAGTSGSQITLIKRGTIAVDPPSCAAAAAVEVTLTITGAAVGDTVVMNPPAAGLTAGLGLLSCRVSATDTVKVRIANLSAGTVDEPSGTWTYCLIRS